MTDTEQEVPGWARQLAKRVDGLAEALANQRNADTPSERREASRDVDDETRALRRLGLTRDEVDRLQKEKRRGEMREVLEELLAEREATTEDDADGDPDAETVVTLRDAATKRTQGRKVKPPKQPEPDEEPVTEDTDQPKNLVQRLGLG